MELLQGKVLVGHALKNDFQSLLLAHPRKMIRDTQRCVGVALYCEAGSVSLCFEAGCLL
jgi:RNA exonuclease 4